MYRINKQQINYLYSQDLLNKYNLKSVKNSAILKTIVLYYKWNNIDKTKSTLLQKIDLEKQYWDSQVKIFIFFFLFWAKKPKLVLKKSLMTFKANFAFKIILNTSSNIFSFLINLFVDNYSRLEEEDETKNIVQNYNNITSYYFNTKLHSTYFSSVVYLFKFVLTGFKLGRFIINMSFVFKKHINMSNLFFSNYFFFWVKGLL